MKRLKIRFLRAFILLVVCEIIWPIQSQGQSRRQSTESIAGFGCQYFDFHVRALAPGLLCFSVLAQAALVETVEQEWGQD